MKRILTFLLSAAMLLSVIPSVSASVAPAEEAAAVEPAAPTEEASFPTVDATAPAGDMTEAAETVDAPVILKEEPIATAAQPVPVITEVCPSLRGAKISWNKMSGISQYYVFIRRADDSGWKKLGQTADTSFEHHFTPDNTPYTYTVRAADKNGDFIGEAAKKVTYAALAVPKLTAVENVNAGQKITWGSVKGANRYKLYLKTASSWKLLDTTEKTSYTNKTLTSGKTYTYTVRAQNTDTKAAGYYDRAGISSIYLTAPTITAFTPVSGGTKITWNAVKGAVRYALFVKSGGSWKRLTTTDKTSYTHSGLTSSKAYTYTVRCVDQNGAFCSGYDTAGKPFRYLTPPVLSSLTSVSDGVLLSWNASPYLSAYRVYRKPFSGKWEYIGKTSSTSYTDTAASKNTLYTYALRGVDRDGVTVTYFKDTATYYKNGEPANGKFRINGTTLTFSDGKIRLGYVTVDGKTYYYNAAGILQKDALVGTAKTGYRYADKNGVIQTNYTGLAKNANGTWYLKNGKLDRTLRDAVTVSGADYLILNGKAHRVRTEEERTLYRAMKLTNRIADRSLSKSRRLKIMFDYIKGAYVEKNPRIPHYHGMDWPIVYANDMLINGVGNCMSYGAELCFIAKAIGYDEVYACHSGGHGWAEIDGLVYDPEWSRHRFNYTYFALSYNAKTDQNYKAAIAPGYAWMHIKVCAHL